MSDANRGFKLKNLHINKHKIFNDFNISFTDREDNPLQIVVIAGINGSGKTTLLEYLSENSNYILKSHNGIEKSEYRNQYNGFDFYINGNLIDKHSVSEHLMVDFFNNDSGNTINDDIKKSLLYFPANKGLEDIKEFLPKYLFKKIFDEKADVEQTYKEVRDYINNIFNDLDIKIEFDSRDAEGNLYFRNKKEEVFSIEDISTGEKTLLSKVLYLYLKKIKDSVILIDEPELSLHPSWQNKILRLYENFAKENNCQIIIATHSPHIIGSAKNEWIRLLTMNENDEVEVINDVLAYGRDIEWVLEEVMGAKSTREESVSRKIRECQELLNDDKYDKAEICIDALEKVIGENDSEVLAMRNDIAFWRD